MCSQSGILPLLGPTITKSLTAHLSMVAGCTHMCNTAGHIEEEEEATPGRWQTRHVSISQSLHSSPQG